MPSLRGPEVRVQGAEGSQKPMALPRNRVGLRGAITSSLDAARGDVARRDGRDVRRGAGCARAAMIFCILTCGADRVDGRPLGSGRACVSRVARRGPLRRPRVDAWALAATSAPSLLGLPRYPRKSGEGGQAAQGRAFASRGRGAGVWPARLVGAGAAPARFHGGDVALCQSAIAHGAAIA